MHGLRPATRRSILDWAEAHLSAGRSFYGLARIASFSSSPHPSGPQGERDARAGADRAGRGGGRVSREGGEGEGRQAESAPVGCVGGVEEVEEVEEEEDLAPPAKRPRSDPRSDLALHMVAHGGSSGNGSGGGQGGKCKRGEVETSSAVYALITCHRRTPGAKCIALLLLELLELLLSFRLALSGRHQSTHTDTVTGAGMLAMAHCMAYCDRGKRDHMRGRHDRRLSGRPAPPFPRRNRAL